MPTTPDLSQKIELAYFKALPPAQGERIEVHFNPATLQYTVANTLKEEGSGDQKKQYVDKTSAKLTMQLVFDTTDSGEDVRVHTDRMAQLLKPMAEGSKQVPPNVEFGWGLYRFTGMVEQYKETIDFFAASGVPLRASVDITLSSQDVRFESAKNPSASVDRNLAPEPVVAPGGGGPSGLANSLGDPRAARAIASLNGSASLRFGAEAGLALSAGVELRAEAAFSAGASAGLSAGIGAGIGGGIGAGISGGIGGGLGIGGSAGIGLGAGAGISASAGASASAVAGGAFAGLRATVSTGTSMPSGQALLVTPGASLAAGSGASFGIGGRVQSKTDSSLGADVGARADLHALIRFG
ncbi:hypothetical protein [Montanilutibacter psychrotolerans]|uniref:Contractile injection system tube protein N-terminal domain-containing protein n=1 Tax=Montanilutibacter psychrotolerans TaxID=1327343 RepID=A0A3M8SZK2_9GAMM|nr:hypothetical protein [Lysobacter psychrotolerans]RNF86193.1 hypothetical protein EER27_01845 [Lysobacter psychrotolerans]